MEGGTEGGKEEGRKENFVSSRNHTYAVSGMMTKVSLQYNGKRTAFSTDGAGSSGYPHGKK